MHLHSAADAYREWLDTLQFDDDGYIPAVIQDRQTREVLMLGHMTRESLEKTLVTGNTWLHSRRHGRLWHRAEGGAAFRPVVEILANDSGDALLFYVDRVGFTAAPESSGFRPALVREESARHAGSAESAGSGVLEMEQLLSDLGGRLRILPTGLAHALSRLRRSLLALGQAVQADTDEARQAIVSLLAQLLVLATAYGFTLTDLIKATRQRLASGNSAATPDADLRQELR